MESSSDSFAWTDASSDSTDTGVMTVSNINKNESEGESDSGKSYKKKLQKQLFSDHETDQVVQRKDRKRKIEEEQIENEKDSPKKKRIKSEPETDDADVPKKKKKSKNTTAEINGLHDKSQDYESNDESYLNKRVKEEQVFSSPSPIKHENRSRISICSDGNGSPKKIKQDKRDNDDDHEEINQEVYNIEADNISSVQKKKKKSKKRARDNSVDDNNDTVEDKFSAVEAVAETQHIDHCTVSKLNENIVNMTVNNLVDIKISKRQKSISNSSKEILHANSDHDENIVTQHFDDKSISKDFTSPRELTISSSINRNSLGGSKKSDQKTPKLSERIMFEDDDDSEIESPQDRSRQDMSQSDMLKQFININAHLKPFVQKVQNDCALTLDDDIWIIKCPHDVDINALKNKIIVLDKKCKIKIDSQTYEGSRVEENEKIAILSVDQSKFTIKNWSVNSTIYLRKRIPKAYLQEDNTMINNQTNFIPLPETKCRHPLFGSHYKKAIKIPKAVSERLKAPPCEPLPVDIERKQKKKHNKDRQISTGVDPDLAATPASVSEPDLKLEPDSVLSVKKKKKKKLKHTDDEYITKKFKRTKHNPESAEAWESEKAIEENLFNF